jgi:hypothetical protein
MTKNQKMLLGVGAVALVGYWLWKRQSATTSFSGGVQSKRMKLATGTSKLATPKCAQCQTECGAPMYGAPNGICIATIDNPNTANAPDGNITLAQHGTIFQAYRCGSCQKAGYGNLTLKTK